MKLNIKRLTETAKIPTRGSDMAAGYDLYADTDKEIVIPPHETVMVSTGITIEIPEGYFGAIYARSGMASKRGLRPANCVGVVDPDYRGAWMIAVHNDTDEPKTVEAGERIAQMVVMPFLSIDFQEVDELSETRRGSGGFGSTGTV